MSDVRAILKDVTFSQVTHLAVVAAFCRKTCLPPGRSGLPPRSTPLFRRRIRGQAFIFVPYHKSGKRAHGSFSTAMISIYVSKHPAMWYPGMVGSAMCTA